MSLAHYNGNQPAFPASDEVIRGGTFGLTKREYLAGLALQGLLSDHDSGVNLDIKAVKIADDLLEALEKIT